MELINILLKMKREINDIFLELFFIMGLKVLLKVLVKEWVDK